MIDLYCERCGPGLLAEPVNASTNLAFLIAAWAAWSLARRHSTLNPEIWMLIVLSVAIGIGSALFHTFATSWSRVLDVLPILLFQMTFIWLYLRRIVSIHPVIVAIGIAAFLAVVLFARRFPETLNGSLPYAPVFLVLLGFGLYHFWRCAYERPVLLAAAGVFLLALFFRSIDMIVCPSFPTGTHFLWHVLIGVVPYLSMRALILNQPNRLSVGHLA